MIGKYNDCLSPLYLPVDNGFSKNEFLRVRCGKCINCRIHRTSEWALRLTMESKYWHNISFLTLTYNDDFLPKTYVDTRLFLNEQDLDEMPEFTGGVYIPTLCSRDLTLFLKQLRKSGAGEYHRFRKTSEWRTDRNNCTRYRIGLRYFGVGEYGSLRNRPHLHILLFGVSATVENEKLCEKLWKKGFVKLTPFNPCTCTYVAGYIQKKLYGDKQYITGKLPEFMRCSQGLGFDWLLDNMKYIDNEHPFINWQGKDGKSFQYGIPSTFRKFLTDIGKLNAMDQSALAFRQRMEYSQLFADLNAKGSNLEDFFRQRFKLALEKEKKKTNGRRKTGEI